MEPASGAVLPLGFSSPSLRRPPPEGRKSQCSQQDQQEAARVRDLGDTDSASDPADPPSCSKACFWQPRGSWWLSESARAPLECWRELSRPASRRTQQVGPFAHLDAAQYCQGGGKVVVQSRTLLPLLETAPAPKTTAHACTVRPPPYTWQIPGTLQV